MNVSKIEIIIMSLIWGVLLVSVVFNVVESSEEYGRLQERYEICITKIPFKAGPGDATYKGE